VVVIRPVSSSDELQRAGAVATEDQVRVVVEERADVVLGDRAAERARRDALDEPPADVRLAVEHGRVADDLSLLLVAPLDIQSIHDEVATLEVFHFVLLPS
jgi:hypothetical protein